MSDSSHECLKMNLTVSRWHTFVIVICMVLKKGVRVSKLVNNSWPVGIIQNWGWKVEAHVSPNSLSCVPQFTLAICSLHPYDTIYCLDLVHVVPESGFYVFVCHFSRFLFMSNISVCFVLFCFVLISLKNGVGGGQLLTYQEMKVSWLLQEPLCVAHFNMDDDISRKSEMSQCGEL